VTIPEDQAGLDRMAAADRLTPTLQVDDPGAFEDISTVCFLMPRLAAALGGLSSVGAVMKKGDHQDDARIPIPALYRHFPSACSFPSGHCS
jgi:hypothetical protein